MSIWDYLRDRIKPPAPRPSPTPITPPPAPPIDPAVVERRQQALRRHASDVIRYKAFVVKAQSTGFLPPAPPSPTWYENHPEYVWNPNEPNPERPAPPKPDIPKPTPIPAEDPARVKARERWSRDMAFYQKLPKPNSLRNPAQRVPVPPNLQYYFDHPDYIYNPKDPQVR